jgi:serine phosphatase RsbU (regulator of sigma subunit)
MKKNLPDFVNKKRRVDLAKYTALAVVVYHIPIGSAFFAKALGIAPYSYRPVALVYAVMWCINVLCYATIFAQKHITVRFIKFMLFSEIFASYVLMVYILFVMEHLGYLPFFASLVVLTFAFVQSSLRVSLLLIAIVSTTFLMVSLVHSYTTGDTSNFREDILVIFIYLPVSSFIAYMCGFIQKQHKEIKRSRNEIKETYQELESFNERMMESLQYAEIIQRSLLPGIDRMKTDSPDSLVIWIPKDIVGGDIFFTSSHQHNTILAVMDCTGHGVPGAFLTMIAFTEIRKIILETSCREPAEILARLNRAMKSVLYKNASAIAANDGLDAAVVTIDHTQKVIRYAGACIPLIYVENDTIKTIKGDRHSLGYRNSDEHFVFTSHTIEAADNTSIYLKTDGYTDQMGGPKNLRYSTVRFKKLISEIHGLSFDIQRKEILRAFFEYMGENEQRDDVTVIGMKV